MRPLPSVLLTSALLASAAHADPRIATRAYQANAVVIVHGKAGIESTIAFAQDERIENVAVGNSAAWQVTPNKRANLLFVKPAGSRAHTNMTVVTDQHTYLFDLVSAAGVAPVYMLRFSYPDAPIVPVVIAAAAITPVPQPVAVADPPPPVVATPKPADLNFAWTAHGDRKLVPQRLFDDGHSTFLSWAKEATLPAILIRSDKGEEGPVNFTVHGDYIVVDGVPTQLILRSGKQMATLSPDARAGDTTRIASSNGTEAGVRP